MIKQKTIRKRARKAKEKVKDESQVTANGSERTVKTEEIKETRKEKIIGDANANIVPHSKEDSYVNKKDSDSSFPEIERRRHKRVKVKLHMIYEDGKTGIKTNVVDMSLGGAFLEMPRPLKEGEEIQLTPILPEMGSETPDVHLKGRVVRVVEYNLPDMGSKVGVGIEFTNIGNNEQRVLSDIFRKNVSEAKLEEEGGGKKQEH